MEIEVVKSLVFLISELLNFVMLFIIAGLVVVVMHAKDWHKVAAIAAIFALTLIASEVRHLPYATPIKRIETNQTESDKEPMTKLRTFIKEH